MQLFEVKPGLAFPEKALKDLLPTVEMVLFFAKLYKLDAQQLGNLLLLTHNTPLLVALVGESTVHSHELQDYLVDLGYTALIDSGEITFDKDPPAGEILPEVWKSLEVTIAKSIQDVADKLKDVVSHLPGKKGEMVFQSLLKMNAKRPTLGDYTTQIKHARQLPNLVVLDVSGSMTEATISTIIEDVVALSWAADAHLAIVSNTTTHWMPGEFSVASVLQRAEFGGTHYETLAALFDEDWGVVVTIADYDSSPYAKAAIATRRGKIEQLLDISLVNQPTYLSEVVGQRAKNVQPLLIAADGASLCWD